MLEGKRIKDVKRYVDWVNTCPDITGYTSYHDAYLAKFEPEQLENQKDLGEF